ncbi:MAG: outer membrane lipoprotein-sorting protein [Nitrospiraceae bacterium]|nr:outer membrane lipoprotein-sorting protein [Nitrospiraceae bacterium]
MRRLCFFTFFAVFAVLLPAGAFAAPLSANEVMAKSDAAYYYPGRDFKARMVMRLVSAGGQQRLREFTMLRKNYGPPGGRQKYFIYFFRPADVKDMTFMVYKYPDRDSDRWLYIPALNMVRRIAAQDKRSSFVGSDFSYEDVSGRNVNEDTHTLAREEKIGPRDCYVVKSTPKTADVEYSYKLSWIDKATYLPLREQYFDKRGELYKVFMADEVKTINGLPTIMKRTMKNVQSGHSTVVEFEKAAYDLGLPDNLFSERFLKQPPRKWIE